MIVFLLSIFINKSKKHQFDSNLLEKDKTTSIDKDLIKKITLSAIFIALGAVLKLFSISTGEMRFGFYEIPVFLSGVALGPLFGGLVGLGADLVYSIFSGYSFSPIMMCSSIVWGLAGSIFYQRKKRVYLIFIVTLLTGFLVTSINSVQLYIYYGMGMWGGLPMRIANMLVKWPLISITMWVLAVRVFDKFIKFDKKDKKLAKKNK